MHAKVGSIYTCQTVTVVKGPDHQHAFFQFINYYSLTALLSSLFFCDSSDGTSWTVTTTCLRTPAAQIPSSCLGCMWVEPPLYSPTQRAGFQVHTCTNTLSAPRTRHLEPFNTSKPGSRSILQFHWHYLTEQRLTTCNHTWKQHDLCTIEK